jgi:hypothetical protein
LLQHPKRLTDFDQSFYITIAYDLVQHGVFSNGVFDKVDSSRSVPPPGRFFGPVYPAFVAVIMKLDPRFARAAACHIESSATGSGSECEAYALPVHLAHAAFLTIGVVAVAMAAELILGTTIAFWISGVLATAALLPDADIFSFVMTESLTFCLYSVCSLVLIWSLKAPRFDKFLFLGALLGALVLTRTAYVVLISIVPILILISERNGGPARLCGYVVSLVIGFAAIVGPWMARNSVSVGSWGLTEEYGSATLIERFAFNDMTTREFFLSFPYCLPVIGPPIVDSAFGKEAMERFVYYTPKSFFHVGRGTRDRLVEAHGRLDPLMGDLVQKEVRENWWRHFLTSVALGWCGMWVGGGLGLMLVPLFAAVVVMGRGPAHRLLLAYSTPAFAMLAMHALIANHYTRYNLILIGPLAVAAALPLRAILERRSSGRVPVR